MALHQKKPGGVWYYSVYVPGRTRRLRGSCATNNKAQALIIEQTLKLAAQKGSRKDKIIAIIDTLYDDAPVEIKLEAIAPEAERLERLAGRETSASYQRRRRQSINRLILWIRDNWPTISDARQIDRVCAQRFAEYLERAGLSCKSRANLIGELSAAWGLLQRGHDKLNNPWPLAAPRGPDRHGNRGKCYTAAQAQAIFAAADRAGHDWPVIIRLAAATGLRYGDIATLDASELCHQSHSLRLHPRKTQRHGIAVAIPIPDDIWELLPKPTSGPIFPRHNQYYASEGQYKPYIYSQILRDAGIDDPALTIHSWRHYFRTRLSEAGVSDDTAMRLGGWTVRDTAARYDHAERLDEMRAAVNLAWHG